MEAVQAACFFFPNFLIWKKSPKPGWLHAPIVTDFLITRKLPTSIQQDTQDPDAPVTKQNPQSLVLCYCHLSVLWFGVCVWGGPVKIKHCKIWATLQYRKFYLINGI